MNTKQNILLTTIAIGLMLTSVLLSPMAHAHKGYHKHGAHYHHQYDKHKYYHHKKKRHKNKFRARVVNVEPIYAPRHGYGQGVHSKSWHIHNGHKQGKSRHSIEPIVGAIAGGIIGNQFGSGSGNTAATIAGAALGAVVADKHTRKHYHKKARRCDSHRVYGHKHYKKHRGEIIGYEVTYRYRGQLYQTHTLYHPGKFIYL